MAEEGWELEPAERSDGGRDGGSCAESHVGSTWLEA